MYQPLENITEIEEAPPCDLPVEWWPTYWCTPSGMSIRKTFTSPPYIGFPLIIALGLVLYNEYKRKSITKAIKSLRHKTKNLSKFL